MSIRPVKREVLFMIKDIETLGEIITRYNQSVSSDVFLSDLTQLTNNMGDQTVYARKVRDEIGTKVIRSANPKDPINQILYSLEDLPEIQDTKILDNNKFIHLFYMIMWTWLKALGYSTQNLYKFIDHYVFNLNKMTRPDYVLYDCQSTDPYNCGRAMIEISTSSSNLPPTHVSKNSKFLIFNTGADEDAMDQRVVNQYLGLEESFEPTGIIPDMFNNHKYKKRIVKEISKLVGLGDLSGTDKVGEYQTQTLKTGDPNFPTKIVMVGENNISFSFPLDYPFSNPIGSYNGLTISDADINWSCSDVGWNPSCDLKGIIDHLDKKFGNKIYIPTKITFDKVRGQN